MPPGSARRGISRRVLLAGGIAAAASARAATPTATLRIADYHPGSAISPFVFGSNEIGVMDGGLPSAELDRRAGVTFRRLGGDLMTGYNWVNNATNAGKNHRHANGAFLLEALRIPRAEWARPAVVIEAMHEASLAMGAKSLVTLPIAGYVAADFASTVAENQTAPSARFVEARWTSARGASDPVDPSVADMPQLVARLVARYGSAATPTGIHAYALDNEPALWFQNHPRLMPGRVTIASFIARSVSAARAIKTIDPAARIFGPASWGATGMVSFQDAPDWDRYRGYGSFIAAYLDAFRRASDQAGQRLLDTLDVHWYPFHEAGNLFRSERPELEPAMLEAPRSLTEPGFRERSWVPQAFRASAAHGLGLPILPSLTRLIERWYPGTALAVSEFNYGGAGRLAAGLALADVLGRYCAAGVGYACHWGSLEGWLGEAYRLYRQPDASGGCFGGHLLPVVGALPPTVSAYASSAGGIHRLILINKADEPVQLDVAFATDRPRHPVSIWGFDAQAGATIPFDRFGTWTSNGWRLDVPPRAARRYDFG